MIPKDYITAWRAQAPWRLDAQVEQDLVISRAIVELYLVREPYTKGERDATFSISGSPWIRGESIRRRFSPASTAT
jgi:hypothetical protein